MPDVRPAKFSIFGDYSALSTSSAKTFCSPNLASTELIEPEVKTLQPNKGCQSCCTLGAQVVVAEVKPLQPSEGCQGGARAAAPCARR